MNERRPPDGTSSLDLTGGSPGTAFPEAAPVTAAPVTAAPVESLAGESPQGALPALAPPIHGVLWVMREWLDAVIIAFILAMFFRVFIVELFKIPTGSMTPTLIGGLVSWVDYNQDNQLDLLFFNAPLDNRPLLFLNEEGRLIAKGEITIVDDEKMRLAEQGFISTQNDRILVNKFAYWFRPPRRGDVVVFNVPYRNPDSGGDKLWETDKSIYIKRCAGEPGDVLTFSDEGRLIVNGRTAETPPFFRHQFYQTTVQATFPPLAEVSYATEDFMTRQLQRIHVPRNEIYVFGDNTHSSLDSRYWGGVPLTRLKGRAFFRYWPLRQMKFLRGE